MFCWGSTVHGELGLGGIEEELILSPRQLGSSIASEIAQVACGVYHTLAVTTAGKVYSCGNNDFSQLGHAKSCKRFELVDDLDSFVITQASCGANFSAVLDEWGRVFCWGSDVVGQLGIASGQIGSVEPKPKIVKGLARNAARVIQIATGSQHCLALTNTGDLYAWGSNENGQLGIGPNVPLLNSPTLINSLIGIPISFIACGGNHSIAVTKSGAVYGWGKNMFGQLGLNDNLDKAFPSQLNTLRTMGVKYVTCGEDFTVFLTKDGGVLTSGAGTSGQLGHGALTNERLPRKVLELMGSVVSQVAAGRRHTLAFVPSRGRVYAFGLGGAGQLGTRTTGNTATPQMVLGPWASPSGVCVLPEMPVGATTLNAISNIFAGGDRSFAAITCYLDHVSPVDHRFLHPRTQVLTIEQDKIAECAAVEANIAVSMDLIEYLELVFGSLSCVNASFLLANDAHYCCSVQNVGVDLSHAALTFRLLAEAHNETIKELVLASVSSCLSQLTLTPLDSESLRAFITLPLFTEFENPRHWQSLQSPFATRLLALVATSATILDKWWRLSTEDYFERLIRLYKNVVVHILMLIPNDHRLTEGCPPSLGAPLELLRKLNETNKSLDHPKVAYDSFYIPELTEKVDISIDYIKWLRGIPNHVWFCNYSFLFDTVGKVCVLETDQSLQMRSAMSTAATRALTTMLFDPMVGSTITAFLELHVRRDALVEDTLRELSHVRDPGDLKKPVKVTFYGEEAEDAGGVRKEFFLLLMSEILDPKYGMFRQYEETRTIWFAEDSLEESIMYYLIGVLCGLAIYNFTIINLPFPLVLYKKLLRERVTLQDLKGLSPMLANSFQSLLDYAGDDFHEVFELNFEVTRESYGVTKTVPLKENGGNILVTQENKAEFVSLYVDYLLNASVAGEFSSFDGGFHKVCGGRTLDLFHAQELMDVVVGNENYDWHQLEQSAIYKNGYKDSDLTIRLFWDVFHELTLAEKKNFLLFLTGSDRIPITGMKAIKIVIQKTGDDKFLPVAHTCFNLLDLPPYRTREKLRYKLLQAIPQTRGFSLV